MSELHTICDYMGRYGTCGRPSYGGRCYRHRYKTSMHHCIECGHGTSSVTGYCRKNCQYKQVYHANKMRFERDEMDALICKILSEIQIR